MLACEIPIVAAKVGVMAEMFRNHSGFLFFPGDCQSLVKAVNQQLVNRGSIHIAIPTWYELAVDFELFFERVVCTRVS